MEISVSDGVRAIRQGNGRKSVCRKKVSNQKFAIKVEYFTEWGPIADFCQWHQLSSQSFFEWRDEVIENGKNVFVKQKNLDLQFFREMKKYKLLVAELAHANETFRKHYWRGEEGAVSLLRSKNSLRMTCRHAGLQTHVLYNKLEMNARALNTERIDIFREAVNSAKPTFIPAAPDQMCGTDIIFIWCRKDKW